MRSSEQSDGEEHLQVTVPVVTKKSLRLKAAKSGETMRAIVLKALAAAGVQVPKKDLQNRRKKK